MIYHLITTAKWEQFLQTTLKVYQHPSLKTEGFIHCSSKTQLLHSAARYFPAEDSLVVLCIVEKRVKHLLKWETSRNDELFPHIYGEIPLSAIETTELLTRNAAGEWER